MTVVTDNASSMKKKAVKDFLNMRNHFCVAHTLNLAVKECVGSDENNQNNYLNNSIIVDLISKSRAIVTYYKQSVKSSNILREMQSQINVEILKVKEDGPTKWSSTFFMFQTSKN